jgi:protein-S-isoprenylcysteine O-methyltransferase Ste14
MANDIDKIIYLAGLIVGSIIRGFYTRGYRHRKAIEEQRTLADTVLLVLTSTGLLLLPLVYVFTPWLGFADFNVGYAAAWTTIAGAIVFAAALWLLFRSHADLAKNWSPVLRIIEGHELVTSGIYRRIRHPMYAAHALWGVAQALLLKNWIAGPSMLVFFIPLYLLRVPLEERMMLERFGDEYMSYMRRTGRLIPRLRK